MEACISVMEIWMIIRLLILSQLWHRMMSVSYTHLSPAGRQVHFKAMRKLASEHPSEKVGAEIRKLYSWNNENDKLINN